MHYAFTFSSQKKNNQKNNASKNESIQFNRNFIIIHTQLQKKKK